MHFSNKRLVVGDDPILEEYQFWLARASKSSHGNQGFAGGKSSSFANFIEPVPWIDRLLTPMNDPPPQYTPGLLWVGGLLLVVALIWGETVDCAMCL